MAEPKTHHLAWDPKKGTTVEVPEAELQDRFINGQVQLVSDQSYPLVAPDGTVYDAEAGSVEAALRQGYRIATASERVRAEAPDQNVRAFAEGIARGATFGTSDAMLEQAGISSAEGIQARRDANPLGSTGGLVLGAMLGSAALGEAAPALVGGRLAASGAAAAGVGGRALAAVEAGAVGAVDGALFNAGSEVSEAVLGKTDVTAERLLAAAGTGAFWGGATGGALGGMLGKARPRNADIEATYTAATGTPAPRGLGKVFRKVQEGLMGIRRWAAEKGGADPEFVQRVMTEKYDEVLEAATGGQAAMDSMVREFDVALDDHLRAGARFAEPPAPVQPKQSPYALGALTPGGANTILADVPPNRPLADALARVRKIFGSDTGVDSAKSAAFANSITRPRADSRLEALESYRALLRQAAPDDVRIAALDQRLGEAVNDISERAVLANIVREQRNRELQQVGAGYLAAAAGFAVGGPAVGLAARAASEAVNQPLASLMKAATRKRVLEAVGGHTREAATAFATGTRLVGKAAQRAGLQRAVAPTTLDMLRGRDDDARRKAYTRRQEELHGAALNAPATTAALERIGHPDLPEASAAMRATVLRQNEYLRQLAPQPLQSSNLLAPQPGPVPDREIRRFAQVDAAVQDPLRVFEQLAAGELPDPAAMDAVREFYPSLVDEAQAAIVEAVAENPDTINWERAKLLTVALGIPAHAAFTKAGIAKAQANARTPLQPATPQGGAPRAKAPRPRTLSDQDAVGAEVMGQLKTDRISAR